MRAADADRDRTVGRLRGAAAEGRLETALAAPTYAERRGHRGAGPGGRASARVAGR